MLLFAMLYVRPALEATSHGLDYACMASEPFQSHNRNVYRFLTPLLAHLLGLRGSGIIVLNLLMAWTLLVMSYRVGRAEGMSAGLSLATAACVACSMPTFATVYWGGYPDSTTYVVVFAMIASRRCGPIFWAAFCVGLTNREAIAFLLPFFFVLRWKTATDRQAGISRLTVVRRDGLLCTTALGVYGLIRGAIPVTDHAVVHNVAFYLEPLLRSPWSGLKQVLPAYHLGFFSVFKFLWLVPVVATGVAIRRRAGIHVLLIVLPVACAVLQSVFARDTSRLLCLAFPSLWLAVHDLRSRVGDRQLARALWVLVGASLLMPPWYVTSDTVVTMIGGWTGAKWLVFGGAE
ncbi:MAG: hypothetical protein B7733_21390 [Myxococcales bacterium FL481]|nr:MAG: hypothetical protein B7733_21390 [Myxococcales bacterium FL481]